jgi:hypothetical protein
MRCGPVPVQSAASVVLLVVPWQGGSALPSMHCILYVCTYMYVPHHGWESKEQATSRGQSRAMLSLMYIQACLRCHVKRRSGSRGAHAGRGDRDPRPLQGVVSPRPLGLGPDRSSVAFNRGTPFSRHAANPARADDRPAARACRQRTGDSPSPPFHRLAGTGCSADA